MPVLPYKGKILEIKSGMQVMLRTSKPAMGRGAVSMKSIGVVQRVYPNNRVSVKFPEQTWYGLASEVKRVVVKRPRPPKASVAEVLGFNKQALI